MSEPRHAADPPKPAPPPPLAGVDEIAAAKARLLELGETASDTFEPTFVRDHPYLFSSLALAAGLVCGRVPMLRKMTLTIALWAGKRTLAKHLQQMARGK
ncbi:MAG: hypothetical protein WD009_08475 [Phycisphaeraceae bacterium]